MIDILINGKLVDILDRNSINLRMNNVLYNPTEIKNVQAEYSFSFNLPTTPNNNKIFDYANELSKVNKFKNTYKCEVYQDGILIFNGSLVIQSIRKGFYNVNLVNIKINTLDDIFGDMKMNEIDWQFPFIGYLTINGFNANKNIKIKFPLVCYGAFQKKPISVEYDYNNYTSKFDLDEYNKWYLESFSPSPNLLELIKKAFKLKGFDLSGDILTDEIIPELYMSTNLANDLIPVYNLGEPALGELQLTAEFSNYKNKNTGQSSNAKFLENKLNYPYQRQGEEWNLESVNIYDIWADPNTKIIKADEQYLFDNHSNCIVIPADGLYKISIDASVGLPKQILNVDETYAIGRLNEIKNVTLNNSLSDDMPVEIQLVRNNDECELIHGTYQWYYLQGDRQTGLYTWKTAYPHENPYLSPLPSVGDFNRNNRNALYNNTGPNKGLFLGYMPEEGEVLAYDPLVNSSFIAGLSSIGKGTPSFIKNGYSWNKTIADKFDSRYVLKGYFSAYGKNRNPIITEFTRTDFNKNDLISSPANSCVTNKDKMSGKMSGIVYLKKNDVIMLKALTRHWLKADSNVIYKFDCNVTVNLKAYSPKNINSIEAENRTWNSPTQFPRLLNISEFLNKDVKVSDFISNFIKEFNLSYINEGKVVYLNKLQLDIDKPKFAINLDGKTNEAESRRIEYPSSMEIKYRIDTDEWGFETTVPPEKMNDTNWRDFGDYGSTEILMGEGENKEEVQLNTSYTYYDTFNIVKDKQTLGTVNIPVISKYSYMIDGYSYEESMKVDGKGLPLRYWFEGKDTGFKVNINGKYPVRLYDTSNTYNGYSLSYKNEKNTILTNYFNIHSDLSGNYVAIRCYLTAYEYEQLKNGANVVFDSDVYIVSEIMGYDAMALNQTELLLIKKK